MNFFQLRSSNWSSNSLKMYYFWFSTGSHVWSRSSSPPFNDISMVNSHSFSLNLFSFSKNCRFCPSSALTLASRVTCFGNTDCLWKVIGVASGQSFFQFVPIFRFTRKVQFGLRDAHLPCLSGAYLTPPGVPEAPQNERPHGSYKASRLSRSYGSAALWFLLSSYYYWPCYAFCLKCCAAQWWKIFLKFFSKICFRHLF